MGIVSFDKRQCGFNMTWRTIFWLKDTTSGRKGSPRHQHCQDTLPGIAKERAQV